MNNLILKRSQLIEAQLTGTGLNTKSYFQQIPNLSRNNIKVYGIEVYTATQLAKSVSNATVLPASALPSLTVTLVDKNGQFPIQDLPVYNLVRSLNSGFVTLLANFEMNLTACYINNVDTANLNTGQVLLFNLYYSLI